MAGIGNRIGAGTLQRQRSAGSLPPGADGHRTSIARGEPSHAHAVTVSAIGIGKVLVDVTD